MSLLANKTLIIIPRPDLYVNSNHAYYILGRGNSGFNTRSRGGRGGPSRGRGTIGRGDHRNDREGSETSERGGGFRYEIKRRTYTNFNLHLNISIYV